MPLRVGVVGVGFGSTVHIPAFQSEGVEVTAVCASRPERAEEAAARFGIASSYTDWHELVDSDDVDAVSVVTPVPMHYEVSSAALAAGKHVLCEKPFSTDARQAEQLSREADESGLTAMIAHEFRFASARMRAKELIDEGYIGEPRLVVVRLVLGGFGRPGGPAPARDRLPTFRPQRDSLAMGAGFLWGLGSHYIDGLRHWFGEIDVASGDLVNFSPDRQGDSGVVRADADDTFFFTLHFAAGGYAQMIGTRAAPFGSGSAIEIYGSEGTLVTPQSGVNPPAHGTLLGARLGEAEGLEPLPIPDRLQPFADDRDDRLMPFRLLTREFVRGVEERSSPAPSFTDGWRCQQVLDAVRTSAATGERVEIS